MHQGTVKFYDRGRGYGFINDERGQSIFFHITNVIGECALNGGDAVRFEIRASEKGPYAYNVEPVEG